MYVTLFFLFFSIVEILIVSDDTDCTWHLFLAESKWFKAIKDSVCDQSLLKNSYRPAARFDENKTDRIAWCITVECKQITFVYEHFFSLHFIFQRNSFRSFQWSLHINSIVNNNMLLIGTLLLIRQDVLTSLLPKLFFVHECGRTYVQTNNFKELWMNIRNISKEFFFGNSANCICILTEY